MRTVGWKRALGVACIAIPVVLILLAFARLEGWVETLKMLGATAIFVIVFILGVSLLSGDWD